MTMIHLAMMRLRNKYQYWPIYHKANLYFQWNNKYLWLRIFIINEEQKGGLNPLFHRAFIVSGPIKLLKMLTGLWVFSFFCSNKANKDIIMSSFKSSRNIQKKECGPDRSVSDNQSSSVTLNVVKSSWDTKSFTAELRFISQVDAAKLCLLV